MNTVEIKKMLTEIVKNQNEINNFVSEIEKMINDHIDFTTIEEMQGVFNIVYEQQTFKKMMLPIYIIEKDDYSEIIIDDQVYNVNFDFNELNEELNNNFNIDLFNYTYKENLHYLIPCHYTKCFDCEHFHKMDTLEYNAIYDNDFEFCTNRFWNIGIIDNVMSDIKEDLLKDLEKQNYCEIEHLRL